MTRKDAIDTVSKGAYVGLIIPDDDPGESPRDWDNLGTMVCWHRNYNLGDYINRRCRADSRVGKGDNAFSATDPDDFREWAFIPHEKKVPKLPVNNAMDQNEAFLNAVHNSFQENFKPKEYTYTVNPEIAIILPIFMYEHSGITISTGREYPFNDRWDSGQVGFIFVTKEQVRAEYSCKRISKKILKTATEVLEGEVKVYDQYLTGDVYGFQLYHITEPDFDADSDDPEDFGEEIDSCWGFYGLDYCKQEVESTIDWHIKDDQEKAWDAWTNTEKVNAFLASA